MAEKIQQLFTITGARGTGKTTLAATYGIRNAIGIENIKKSLSEIIYLDSENSANNLRRNFRDIGVGDFGEYINLQERFSDLPGDDDLLDRINKGQPPWVSPGQAGALIDYYKYTLSRLAEITPNRYSTLVIDTCEKLEAGMAAMVERDKARWGVTITAYGKLWTEGVFPLYENLLQAIHGRGIETVILTFHLKNVWEGNRPVTGKVAMSGKKILRALSRLMLWLVNDSRNPNGEPAGLVLKERMGKMMLVDGKLKSRQMLPPRIPTCDWEHIDKYLHDGYNIQEPSDRERPSLSEEDMISDLYNDAQTALMLADAKLEEQKNAIAIMESGFGGAVSESTEAKTFVKNGNVPTTRADAVRLWREMGRKVPAFNARLDELNVGDDDIGGRWNEIVGERDA